MPSSILTVKDFSEFIRLRLSIFTAVIGVLGYSLFNPISNNVFFVFMSCLCVVAFSYAYNNMKDVKEDKINRKKVSSFTGKKEGQVILISLALAGYTFSLFLSFVSRVFYILMLSVGFAYSYFRLNARSFSHFIKNFYAAFSLCFVFFLGAGIIDVVTIKYYLILSVFIFGGSIIADLRDYAGDIKVGKKSLPTVLGYEKSKILSCIILLVFSVSVFALGMQPYFLFTIGSFFLIIFVLRNNPGLAHFIGGFFVLLTIFWTVAV